MSRLNSISTRLANSFSASFEANRLAAVHFACSRAVRENALGGDHIDQALEAIQTGKSDPILRKRMDDLSAAYDGKYFELIDEEGEAPLLEGALENFQKARAASALAFGLTADHLDDALYEAISATSERDSLMASLQQML